MGVENVAQVVANCASSYVGVFLLLETTCLHIFWSPCVVHCINNILKKNGDLPVHKFTIEKARRIIISIYRYSLSAMSYEIFH